MGEKKRRGGGGEHDKMTFHHRRLLRPPIDDEQQLPQQKSFFSIPQLKKFPTQQQKYKRIRQQQVQSSSSFNAPPSSSSLPNPNKWLYGTCILTSLLNHGWSRTDRFLPLISNLDRFTIFVGAIHDAYIAWNTMNLAKQSTLLGLQYSAIRCFVQAKRLGGRFYANAVAAQQLGSSVGSTVTVAASTLPFHIHSVLTDFGKGISFRKEEENGVERRKRWKFAGYCSATLSTVPKTW
eukprot:6806256-Ditylum_brightwellii.AAC.1